MQTQSPLRFVAYSTASCNALASGYRASEAINRACKSRMVNDEFLVVFSTRSTEDIDRFDARWPQDAEIVWRGENELAQRYRGLK